jgi:hypothetical protein
VSEPVLVVAGVELDAFEELLPLLLLPPHAASPMASTGTAISAR